METSRHHLFWERRDYRSPLEKRLRLHGAMVIKAVANDTHTNLHLAIAPPHKPTPDLMAGALVRLAQTDLVLPLDGLFVVAEYMFERDTKLSNRIGDHLLAQAGFLDEAGYAN